MSGALRWGGERGSSFEQETRLRRGVAVKWGQGALKSGTCTSGSTQASELTASRAFGGLGEIRGGGSIPRDPERHTTKVWSELV